MKKVKVMKIDIFLDEDLHLTGKADLSEKLFDDKKVEEEFKNFIHKLYKCAKDNK